MTIELDKELAIVNAAIAHELYAVAVGGVRSNLAGELNSDTDWAVKVAELGPQLENELLRCGVEQAVRTVFDNIEGATRFLSAAAYVTPVGNRLFSLYGIRGQKLWEITCATCSVITVVDGDLKESLASELRRMGDEIGMPATVIESCIVAGPDSIRNWLTDSGAIFIGHGRSPVWRDLWDFLSLRLGLKCVEFNSISAAGVTTQQRLLDMLNDCSFSFLIMTAEDTGDGGRKHARENVIHEIGLLQGRLGFARAIVLLEDGCEVFSNIAGLGQIRFPPDNIMAKSEEIRRVLEREGII